MSDPETEDMEAAIVRATRRPGYGHIEAILHTLEQYKREMTHKEAVARLHSEVCDE
jgi:hypothetical protein